MANVENRATPANSPDSPGSADNRSDALSVHPGNKQSDGAAGEHFVLVDSEQGIDIGDDLFAIGEVRRADRLPHRQGGASGQNQQSTSDAPDTTGSTGV